jgi:hypothetical protein
MAAAVPFRSLISILSSAYISDLPATRRRTTAPSYLTDIPPLVSQTKSTSLELKIFEDGAHALLRKNALLASLEEPMNKKIFTALSATVFAAGLFAQPAAATRINRHEVRSVDNCVMTNGGHQICGEAATLTKSRTARVAASAGDSVGARGYASANEDTTIFGGRPSDCPHSYCGCGLRKYLGLDDTRLNLASNWARFFPHESAPRAGLAAVRSHHVMYIESAVGDGQWLVRDYNSGGGLSRLHVRNVRGYAFVNPRAQLAAR